MTYMIPIEIIQYEIFKYLPIKSIVSFCNINKSYRNLSDNLWCYLLLRDYKITDDGPHVKQRYIGIRRFRMETDIKKSDYVKICQRSNIINLNYNYKHRLTLFGYIETPTGFEYSPNISEIFLEIIRTKS